MDVDDVEALAGALLRVRGDADITALTSVGRATAEGYDYEKLDAAWDALLTDFVGDRS